VLEGELRHADELDTARGRPGNGDGREPVRRFDLSNVTAGDVVARRLTVPTITTPPS